MPVPVECETNGGFKVEADVSALKFIISNKSEHFRQ
jgi:hypothetical protein